MACKIAKDIGANRSSVRVNLSRLTKEGIVENTKYGFYRIRPEYAVGNDFTRNMKLQNLHFYVDDYSVKREDNDRNVVIEFPEVSEGDSARITIEFGWKRRKLHWWVKADAGLDYYGLSLARKAVDFKLLLLGYDPPVDWFVERSEFLTDFWGSWRTEGLPSCVTYTAVSGLMEKIYKKKYGLRREIRAQTKGEQTLDGIMAMVQGGVNYGQLIQLVASTQQELHKVLSYLEQNNRLLEAVIKSKQ